VTAAPATRRAVLMAGLNLAAFLRSLHGILRAFAGKGTTVWMVVRRGPP
jgi:hypothetical protein